MKSSDSPTSINFLLIFWFWVTMIQKKQFDESFVFHPTIVSQIEANYETRVQRRVLKSLLINPITHMFFSWVPNRTVFVNFVHTKKIHGWAWASSLQTSKMSTVFLLKIPFFWRRFQVVHQPINAATAVSSLRSWCVKARWYVLEPMIMGSPKLRYPRKMLAWWQLSSGVVVRCCQILLSLRIWWFFFAWKFVWFFKVLIHLQTWTMSALFFWIVLCVSPHPGFIWRTC